MATASPFPWDNGASPHTELYFDSDDSGDLAGAGPGFTGVSPLLPPHVAAPSVQPSTSAAFLGAKGGPYAVRRSRSVGGIASASSSSQHLPYAFGGNVILPMATSSESSCGSDPRPPSSSDLEFDSSCEAGVSPYEQYDRAQEKQRRAPSAMDLRSQFKAAEVAAAEDRLTARSGVPADDEDDMERVGRALIRDGKRPLEGERALPFTAPVAPSARFDRPPPLADLSPRKDHVVLTPDMSPPRSAPPRFSAPFAARQALSPVDESKRSPAARAGGKFFPLPLQLLQRRKHPATAVGGGEPAQGQGLAHAELSLRDPVSTRSPAESDLDSAGPSPLFESDWEGTARTAPSTPNDTPFQRACFDLDELAPKALLGKFDADGADGGAEDAWPLGARLGEGSHVGLGLGVDLDGRVPHRGRDDPVDHYSEFPLVPLRGAHRAAFPLRPREDEESPVPSPTVPSLSISPSEPLSEPEEIDAPSRIGVAAVAFSDDNPSTSAIPETPPNAAHVSSSPLADSRAQPTATPQRPSESATVRTPQHLLASASLPRFLSFRSHSFSFSPAPLRLVKVQVLRAAGYSTTPESAPAESDSATAAPAANTTRPPPQQHTAVAVQGGTTAAARSNSGWRSIVGGVSGSPLARLEETVPAKLILFVRLFSSRSRHACLHHG